MAVTENWQSRKMRITMEGTTITQIYSASADDFDAWIAPLPVIGDYWSDRGDLRCTDINVRWITDSTCNIVCFWSTENLGYVQKRAGTEISFDFNIEQNSVEAYRDTDGAWIDWESAWTSGGEAFTAENKPELLQYVPRLTATVKVYAEHWTWNVINNGLGRINKTDFIK